MSEVEQQTLDVIAMKIGGMEATQKSQAEAIGRLASNIDRLIDKLDRSDEIAREADQRARSAHHRIDRIDKIMFWAGTTIIGAIILAFIGFALKGGLSQ